MSQRIIQVSSYYPPHLGGQENAVQGLAEQLADAGHDVHVVTSGQGSDTYKTAVENGVTVKRLRSFEFGHAPIMPGFPGALARIAKKKSIMHLHIGQAFTPEMVAMVSKLRRVPFVAQLHIDFEPSGPAGFLLPLYKKMILTPVLKAAAAVIVLNETTMNAVRNVYGYKGPAVVLHNGIDDAFFAINRPDFAPEPPKTLKLLFVGRLSHQKNVIALLMALKSVKRPVHLDIIGDGEERDTLESAIKTLGLTNVTMHGRLERAEVLKFYATADALVMPSLYEAQPLVLLEALAARIPIIGTDVIGVAEHIKDAGIIVQPNAQGIAEGIRQYDTRYAELPDMVARGYAKAKGFRWEPTIKKYEALYHAVLET